jgi:N-acetylneuraminic acid mutarotase
MEGSSPVVNGQIWVLGGQIDAQLLTDEVRSYDPATNRWTLHTPLPEKRKAGFAYYDKGVIYYSNGDSYHNGQPVSTLVAKVPKSVSALAFSSAVPNTNPNFSTATIGENDRLFELV